MSTPTVADMALIQCLAEALIAEADKLGVTVMIERRSVPPLRMGGTEPVITIWPTKAPVSGLAAEGFEGGARHG
jgi:hypothetical protein